MGRRDARYTGDWGSVDCTCNILNKKESVFNYFMLMLDRSNQMFKYSGLPKTISFEMLETFLQVNGHIGFAEVGGNLYALPGSLGGSQDCYYRPTQYIMANPVLGTVQGKILNHLEPLDKEYWSQLTDCVLCKNDTNFQGLFYLFARYATQLAENDISVRSAQINSRQRTVVITQNDRQAASADAYFKNLEDGKIGATISKDFQDSIRVANTSTQAPNTIIQLIELQQYLKASWFNEMGLNANFNMKREYLSEEELRASTDLLLPLVDNMLFCRQEALELVNKTFGTNISVEKNSAWANKQEELDTEQEQKEADLEATKVGTQNAEGGDNGA